MKEESRDPFHHFYLKIDSSAHFDSFFSNVGQFFRKMKNIVKFSIIKIRIFIIFMSLRSKRMSEIYPKVGSLDGKTEQDRLKMLTLLSFFQKATTIFEKLKALIDYPL